MPTVVTTDQTVLNENDITVPEVVTKDNLAPQVPENNVPIRRSSRIRNQSNRLGIPINLSDVMSSEDLSDNGYHKIKRVLGHINNMQQFLVHIKGEPAENAIWVEKCKLSKKALSFVQEKPPPVILDI